VFVKYSWLNRSNQLTFNICVGKDLSHLVSVHFLYIFALKSREMLVSFSAFAAIPFEAPFSWDVVLCRRMIGA